MLYTLKVILTYIIIKMICKGRVYKIINSIDNEIYVGSTFNQLRHRWQGHKKDYKKWINGKCNKCSIFEKFKLLGIENFKIILIKEYLVYREHKKDRKHLLSKEQLWINKLKCINSNCSFNPIPKKEREKQYRLNNKEKINERKKQYYENNKEKAKEKAKEYYEKNKEKVKEYYENNKEKIKQKINCKCGSIINKIKKKRHERSKKHLKYIKKIEDKKIIEAGIEYERQLELYFGSI